MFNNVNQITLVKPTIFIIAANIVKVIGVATEDAKSNQ